MNPDDYFGVRPIHLVDGVPGDFFALAHTHSGHDHDYLREFITHGSALDRTATPYRAIRRQKPLGLGVRLPPTHHAGPPPQQFRNLLKASLARQLDGARRAVVAMSGGLDSTALAALAVELLGASNVTAVTIGYEWRIPDPEPAIARQVAAHLGIEWHWIRADNDLLGWPPPKASIAGPRVSAPQSELDFNDQVDTDVPVIVGYGGDPLLVGESGYYARIRRERGTFAALRHVIAAAAVHPTAPGLGIRSRLNGTFRPQEPGRELADAMFDPAWSDLFEGAYLSWKVNEGPKWLFPFFDPAVYGFVSELDMSPWRVNKHLLRAAFEDSLPDWVITRPKSLAEFPSHLLPPEAANWMQTQIENAPPALFDWVNIDATLAEMRPGIYDWNSKLRLLRVAATAQFMSRS